MFKIVIIKGPKLGTKYILKSGQITLGRTQDANICLNSKTLSKIHCTFFVTENKILIQDHQSANGTLVNGNLIQKTELKEKDIIEVGEYVLQLRSVEDNLPLKMAWSPTLPTAQKSSDSQEIAPKTIKEWFYFIIHKIVTWLCSLNTQYEWHILAFGMLLMYWLGIVVMVIVPAVSEGNRLALQEVLRRASLIASIGAQMSPVVFTSQEAGNSKIDLQFLDHQQGVKFVLITDLDGRIILPVTQANAFIDGPPEGSFVLKLSQLYQKGKEIGWSQKVSDNIVLAIEPIKVYNSTLSKNQVVGMCVVSLEFEALAISSSEALLFYCQAFILLTLLGGLLGFIFYLFTRRRFDLLKEELDLCLRGELTSVSMPLKMIEMKDIYEQINGLVLKIPKTSVDETVKKIDFFEQTFSEVFQEYCELNSLGLAILDEEKKVHSLNNLFEEITGIRSENSIGQIILSVVREESFGNLLEEMLSKTLTFPFIKDEYEFSGMMYEVYLFKFFILSNVCYAFFLQKRALNA